jgi:hypothetical protein
MRKFKFTDATGFDLVEEFAKRVVADVYDNYCDQEDIYVSDSSDEFKYWLAEQSELLYNEIMEGVNNYCDFDGVEPPPEVDEEE